MRVCGICGRYFDGFVVKKGKKRLACITSHKCKKSKGNNRESSFLYIHIQLCIKSNIQHIYMYIKE